MRQKQEESYVSISSSGGRRRYSEVPEDGRYNALRVSQSNLQYEWAPTSTFRGELRRSEKKSIQS
jgi:hypothetical protein